MACIQLKKLAKIIAKKIAKKTEIDVLSFSEFVLDVF
jgi:hypothetical protein